MSSSNALLVCIEKGGFFKPGFITKLFSGLFLLLNCLCLFLICQSGVT